MARQLDPVDFPPLAGAEGPLHEGLQLPPWGFALEEQGGGDSVSQGAELPSPFTPRGLQVQSQSALVSIQHR